MDLTDLVRSAGVVEDTLGRGRLTGVDMGDDADVTRALKILVCHVLLSSAFSPQLSAVRRQRLTADDWPLKRAYQR
jgi:hypothetical protein